MKLKRQISLGVFSLLLVSLLGGFWWLSSGNLSEGSRTFVVKKGEGLLSVAGRLESERLVGRKEDFVALSLVQGRGRSLKAGTYLLDSSMSAGEMLDKISRGDTAKVKVTIPEGLSSEEIERRLYDALGKEVPVSEARAGDYIGEYWFLEDLSGDSSLSGFLFPDTYYFSSVATKEEVVGRMLRNFDNRFSEQLTREVERRGLSMVEVVKTASLLEEELKTKEEMRTASDLLWKRREAGMALQVDASPYTYKHRGLPPEPISNPGLKSLEAALYPKETSYWYYLTTPEGEAVFNRTLEEHNEDKVRYLK